MSKSLSDLDIVHVAGSWTLIQTSFTRFASSLHHVRLHKSVKKCTHKVFELSVNKLKLIKIRLNFIPFHYVLISSDRKRLQKQYSIDFWL